jgi:hypothetical protein
VSPGLLGNEGERYQRPATRRRAAGVMLDSRSSVVPTWTLW